MYNVYHAYIVKLDFKICLDIKMWENYSELNQTNKKSTLSPSQGECVSTYAAQSSLIQFNSIQWECILKAGELMG